MVALPQQTLGPVITDYDTLTMKFLKDGKIVQLNGQAQPNPAEASLHQLKRMISTDFISEIFHLQPLPPSSSPKPSPTSPPELQPLLPQFAPLFETPTGLPPRPTDHNISLTEGSDPVDFRSYRYPHFQNLEIEKLVSEMWRLASSNAAEAPFPLQFCSSKIRMAAGDSVWTTGLLRQSPAITFLFETVAGFPWTHWVLWQVCQALCNHCGFVNPASKKGCLFWFPEAQ